MTPKQSDLLFKLALGNVVIWSAIGFIVYGLPILDERNNAQATAIALRQTQTAPTATKPIPTATPTLPRAIREPSTPAPRISAPIIVATAAPVPQVIAAPAGNSPSNPASTTGAWQTLNAGASVWMRLGGGGDHIDAFLDARPMDGVTMQVYAPGNLEQPIGQGTFQKSSGQLVWSGGKWSSSGEWMAKIINGNSGAVQYKLTANTTPIPQCDSISYWEKINGQDVYWTRCK